MTGRWVSVAQAIVCFNFTLAAVLATTGQLITSLAAAVAALLRATGKAVTREYPTSLVAHCLRETCFI